MVTIGTLKSSAATKVLLCGSGESGKEVVIKLQQYGVAVQNMGMPCMDNLEIKL